MTTILCKNFSGGSKIIMKQKLKIVLSTAFIILLADHLTKWLIVMYLPYGSEIPVIEGFFDLVHTRNTGAAFGILSTWNSSYKNFFFYSIGFLALIFLYYYVQSTRDDDKISLLGLGLIFGGALGNLTDRWWRGSVVDFLSVHYYDHVQHISLFGKDLFIPLTWPAFNVADSAICVGITLLLIQNFRTAQASATENSTQK